MSALRFPDVDAEAFLALLASRRELTDAQIAPMLRRILPLERHNGRLRCIAPAVYHLRNFSFVRGPKLGRVPEMRVIAHINTLHRCDPSGMCRPTIEEVLSMIPEDLVSSVMAFQVFGPISHDDLCRQQAAVDRGYRVAVTVLYGR